MCVLWSLLRIGLIGKSCICETARNSWEPVGTNQRPDQQRAPYARGLLQGSDLRALLVLSFQLLLPSSHPGGGFNPPGCLLGEQHSWLWAIWEIPGECRGLLGAGTAREEKLPDLVLTYTNKLIRSEWSSLGCRDCALGEFVVLRNVGLVRSRVRTLNCGMNFQLVKELAHWQWAESNCFIALCFWEKLKAGLEQYMSCFFQWSLLAFQASFIPATAVLLFAFSPHKRFELNKMTLHRCGRHPCCSSALLINLKAIYPLWYIILLRTA